MPQRRARTTAVLVAVLASLIAAAPASAAVELTAQWSGSLGGFIQPIGVATDSAGRIYVANRQGGLYVLAPSGAFIRHQDGFTNLFGVAVGPTGDLYATDGASVKQFDSSGNFIRSWGKDVGGSGVHVCTSSCLPGAQGTAAGQFSLPDGVATDSAGNVYVADGNNHRVQKFSSSGTFIRMWGKDVGGAGVDTCTDAGACGAGGLGTTEGEFASPRGVAVDADDNLYIADSVNDRVQKLSPAGAFVKTWGNGVGGVGNDTCTSSCGRGNPGTAEGHFNAPSGVAVDASGSIYVVDRFNRRVQRFDALGSFVGMWGKDVGGAGVNTCTSSCSAGTAGSAEGELTDPVRVGTGPGGRVYVTDFDTHSLHEFDAAGGFVRMWGYQVGGDRAGTCTSSCTAGAPGGTDPFSDPEDVGRDAAGNVYVADFEGGRIHKFDPVGRSLFAFAGLGTGGGELGGANGLAVAATGDLYVAEASNHRVSQFNSEGQFVRMWGKGVNLDVPASPTCLAGENCGPGTADSADGAFDGPSGIAVDSTGNVYVADSVNNRIQKFSATGAYLSQFGTLGTGPGELSGPSKIVIDGAGNVHVTEQGNRRVSTFSSSGSFLRAMGKDVGGAGVNSCTSTCQAGSAGTGDGAFDVPSGVSTDSTGNVYVSETSPNNRVQVFGPGGAFVQKWGGTGSLAGQFEGAAGLVAASGGRVYVADSGNDRIQLFTETSLVPVTPPGGGDPTPDPDPPPPGAGDPTPVPEDGPTPEEIRAVLLGDLKAVATALTKARIAGVLRRKGVRVKGIASPGSGSVRIQASARSNAATTVLVLKGTRAYTAAGKATLRLTLTKPGRRLLRRSRSKVAFTLRARYTDAAGRTSTSRKVTVRRR